MEFPTPVTTVYKNPTERVLFEELRDANPFFHLFEAIWMLAGRNDVDFVAEFVPRMREYSDDGKTLNGAYGYRWREHFCADQIKLLVEELNNHQSRRAVLTMWDGEDLLTTESKDIPCNTHIYFRIVNGKMDMTVCNRSNDIIWGLYGANTVHLSILHEFIASAVGVPLGVYRHLSNNFHLYPKNVNYRSIAAGGVVDYYNPNIDNSVTPTSLEVSPTNWELFLTECELFCHDPSSKFASPFLQHTAQPMYELWKTRDAKDIPSIAGEDWARAAEQWIQRRE
jgi:hypothetical protein